jgi:uncharacterized membrane protein
VNEFALVRALHVLGVVLWIGGVAMVTTVLLSAVQRYVLPAEQVEFFERIESRFAAQARWTTALVGITGLWLPIRSIGQDKRHLEYYLVAADPAVVDGDFLILHPGTLHIS